MVSGDNKVKEYMSGMEWIRVAGGGRRFVWTFMSHMPCTVRHALGLGRNFYTWPFSQSSILTFSFIHVYLYIRVYTLLVWHMKTRSTVADVNICSRMWVFEKKVYVS